MGTPLEEEMATYSNILAWKNPMDRGAWWAIVHPDVQAGVRKGRGTRDQIANICWMIEKAREFQEISISALLTMPKPLTVWITINCGKF